MLVSVVVPIYRVEKYLEKCLDSIINQTYRELEIILVDDGSDDGCPKICDSYAQIDSRVKVIHKLNGGLVSARKAGVHKATGEFIIFVDGDDWLALNAVEKAVHWQRESQADVVVYGYYSCGAENIKSENYFDVGYYDKKQLKSTVYGEMLFKNVDRGGITQGFAGIYPSLWNKLFYLRKIKKYIDDVPDNISLGEDACITYPALIDSESVYICDEPLYYYRQNNESMTKSYRKNQSGNTIELITYLKNVLPLDKYNLNRQIDRYVIFILLSNVANAAKAPTIGQLHENVKTIHKYLNMFDVKAILINENIRLFSNKYKLYLMMTKFHVLNVLIMLLYTRNRLLRLKK
jgi:glycosyltransferase involved in cell wall biosynthesis